MTVIRRYEGFACPNGHATLHRFQGMPFRCVECKAEAITREYVVLRADDYQGAVSPERVHAYIKAYGRLGYDAAHLDAYLRGEFDAPSTTTGGQ